MNDREDLFGFLAAPFSDVEFTLASAVGEEAINALPLFTLEVVCREEPFADLASLSEEEFPALKGVPDDAIETALIQQAVSFRIGPEGVGSVRYGVVIEATRGATFEHEGASWVRLRVTVAPRAWRLTLRRNSKVFQQKYSHEIVNEVLKEHGVRAAWYLDRSYPIRHYCIQYDETDWEFITRLFAEEGIFFFFRHAATFTPPPLVTREEEDTSLEDTLDDINKARKAVEGVSKLLGEDAKLWGKIASSATAMALDAVTPVGLDEEDPRLWSPFRGGVPQSSDASPGEVLVYTDSVAYYHKLHANPAVDDGTATDDPSQGEPLTLTVNTHQSGMAPFEHAVVAFRAESRLASDPATDRDYDFRKPLLNLAASTAPGSAPPAAEKLEVYEHHGQYEVPDVSVENVRVRREQLRAAARTYQGRSLSPRVVAGHKVDVRDPRSGGAPTELVIVSARHRFHRSAFAAAREGSAATPAQADLWELIGTVGMQAREVWRGDAMHALQNFMRRAEMKGVYENEFVMVPGDVAWRPPRPVRRVRTVTETATVVGPVGSDLHTDRHGRVRVQFHWDRLGPWTEASSCWVRVAQNWAGPGWGFQFVPRIGMEVLVTFVGGDPDRPVVTGCLYNGTHPTPEPLPERATRSGIRTQSTPEGGGFNELSFEDQRGCERVYVRAERDLDLLVRNDRAATVLRDDTVTISNDRRASVGRDLHESVGRDAVRVTGRSETCVAAGDRTERVGRHATDHVAGDSSHTTDGVHVTQLQRDDIRVVAGDQNVVVRGSQITTVGGVAAGAPPDTAASVTYVDGNLHLTATGAVVIKAERADGAARDSSLRLECGSSVIELRDGRVRITADVLELVARQRVYAQGGAGETPSTLALQDDGATMAGVTSGLLDATGGAVVGVFEGRTTIAAPGAVSIYGSTVEFDSRRGGEVGPPLRAEPDSPPPPNVTVRLTHEGGDGAEGLVKVRFRAVAGERVTEGVTDADGNARFYAPEGVSVAQLTAFASEVFPNRYTPERGPLTWAVHLLDALPPVESPEGVRARLRNLGFKATTELATPVEDPERLDPQSRAALRAFQRSESIATTGLLDAGTRDHLREVYGE